MDNRVDLVSLLEVLVFGFNLELLTVNDLLLNVLLVGQAILFASLLRLALDLVLNLLGAQHDFFDLSVLLLHTNTVTNEVNSSNRKIKKGLQETLVVGIAFRLFGPRAPYSGRQT